MSASVAAINWPASVVVVCVVVVVAVAVVVAGSVVVGGVCVVVVVWAVAAVPSTSAVAKIVKLSFIVFPSRTLSKGNELLEIGVHRCRRAVRASRRTVKLENVPAEISVLRNAGELLLDECRIDHKAFAAAVLGFKADIFEELFHHRLETAGANIL